VKRIPIKREGNRKVKGIRGERCEGQRIIRGDRKVKGIRGNRKVKGKALPLWPW
jgi:hypothetical protein